ncbi:hypothetical protein Ae406Ps2_5685c [Pseudonocardia sp. Ae406_Ps2]|nr:hypothetical protein Ae331Ps2_0274 [Pseudonocardia sp. Ae331_Ps2]OLM05685.1 hypothetical protein Ae406Ps2_5685c [Pseudonocardia sp. Ae406_Ps2]OLM15158.1 hypothetical protein Ae505Ps2_5290 [Pseudonocardia sp. Ae505_Ps2]OLM27260.1 hypothetical protein Ae706Ps2_5694c [Pseudonocardia sp. Ae706_Ps2]OLM30431.1 hypothetical protein Ae717Ps2_1326c [Pseudonocardia sp. Ae717_Ps2]
MVLETLVPPGAVAPGTTAGATGGRDGATPDPAVRR